MANDPFKPAVTPYKKSATANATEAPTSGITKSAADLGATSLLTADEHNFCNIVDQHWSLYGELFSAQVGLEAYDIPMRLYEEYLSNDKVRGALTDRGVNFRNLDFVDSNRWKTHALTAEQLVTANVMLDLIDQRSEKKKLQDLGVTTAKYQRWLKDPAFSNYLRQRTEALLGGAVADANMALIDRARGGDVKSIQYLHEITGRYVKVGSAPTEQSAYLDAKQLVQNIITIIVDEVDDGPLAVRIAERLKKLITVQQISGELLGEAPITIPEVVPARELTPEIRALMDTGVGMDT